MVKAGVQLYKFGEFRLDAVRRILLRDDKPVQLPSRALDVLLALLEHSQSVMDKGELMRLVWGDRVVEENNLTRHISTLRRVFDESPNDHRYIVTVPGMAIASSRRLKRSRRLKVLRSTADALFRAKKMAPLPSFTTNLNTRECSLAPSHSAQPEPVGQHKLLL